MRPVSWSTRVRGNQLSQLGDARVDLLDQYSWHTPTALTFNRLLALELSSIDNTLIDLDPCPTSNDDPLVQPSMPTGQKLKDEDETIEGAFPNLVVFG